MVKVADIAGTVQYVDKETGNVTGARNPYLYQCPRDKTVTVD